MAEDLKNMIYGFRVSELQDLLGFAGRNKSGKKQELQLRALELLKLRSAPVQMKVVELYRRRYHVPQSTSNDRVSSLKIPVLNNPADIPAPSTRSGHMMSNNMNNYSSAMCVKPVPQMGHPNPSAYPVHPDVQLKPLPFYDVLSVLLQPSSLSPTGSSTYQENHFTFHLTPQQVHEISISRDYNQEYNVQIQLRFCMMETSCEQDDNFPPSICVKVNSKMCQLPNPIPTNRPGVEPKRPSRPVNITHHCRLSATTTNTIVVSWGSEYNRGYVVSVFLVRKLDSSTLLSRLRSNGIRNPDHTRAMIKEKLQQSPDSEIATTSLRGSLMCPIGKMRMQMPCRPSTCTHLQCFDASLFLKMNEKKPRWICPVCDKPALFKHLAIDGLFSEITTKAKAECTEVQFHEDGSWTPVINEKKAHEIDASVDLSPTTSRKTSSKKQKVEVVDLTIDSDSDDGWKSDLSAFYDSTFYRKAPSATETSSSSYQPKVPTTAPFISLPSPSSPLSGMSYDIGSSSLPPISNLAKPSTATSYSTALPSIGKPSIMNAKGILDYDIPRASSSQDVTAEAACSSTAVYVSQGSPFYPTIGTPASDMTSATQSYSSDTGLDLFSILNTDNDMQSNSMPSSDVRVPPSTTPDIISLE